MTIDLEIARAANLKPITEIASTLGIPNDVVLQHGPHIAKIALPIPRFSGCSLISIIAAIPKMIAIGEGKIRIHDNPAYPAKMASHDLPTGAIMRTAALSAILVDFDCSNTGLLVS